MTRPTPSALSTRFYCPSLVTVLFLLLTAHACNGAYYGKLIGKLSEFHHGVSGEVYAVDGRTLFIKDFTYDGEGPAAYFYVGNGKTPDDNGFRVRDEHGTTNVLKRYRKKGITLTLPEGKTLNNIKWFYVWCDDFSVNFGDVKIPRGFDYPRPQKLGALSGIHGVSSDPVVIVDAQTLLIPNFSYDGEAPDAKFWVGAGSTPSPQGIRVPDENGKEQPLRRYNRKTIVLTLPGDLTVHQLGHFGVWCEAFAVDFGHVQIPRSLNIPPSLKMLGVSPQNVRGGQGQIAAHILNQELYNIPPISSPSSSHPSTSLLTQQHQRPTTFRPSARRNDQVQSKLNCEVLEDSLAFEVRWAVAGDSVVVQLVAKLGAGEYMSFGLSANPERNVMVGGDVVVAWVDKQTLQGYAIDYILDAKSQCSGGRGSCPDTRLQENTNSVRLLNAAMVNGYSIVTYQRPLKASDELDQQIITNGSQAIIWAIGPLNDRNEVSFHSSYLKTDRFIEFGRPPVWNCPTPDQELPKPSVDDDEKDTNQGLIATSKRPLRNSLSATPAPASTANAWEIPPIQCNEPDDGVFYAQIGPTGGKHGYPAITGHVGWGIAWYINGLLIPEINVVRGKKYTFIVEGGEDAEKPARYHPFYITDDPIGGYAHKTPEEKAEVKIFAGAKRQRGTVRPTAVGRLCRWVADQNQPPADEFPSFGAFQRILTLLCESGSPGVMEWTPDESTPDTVYYQCFTHRYLGWKINVHDSCDLEEAASSENYEQYADLNGNVKSQTDLESEASIRVSGKVTPVPEFLQKHQEFNQKFGHRLNHYHHYPHYYSNTNTGSLVPHNMQLTRTYAPNNLRDAYERMQSLSYEGQQKVLYNSPTTEKAYPHRDVHHALLPTRHIEENSVVNVYGDNQVPNENGVPHAYTVHPDPESDQGIRSSNQLSKLVPDSRPATIMNHAMMKIPHPIHGLAPQTILYSKTPQHMIFHQPQRTQLMIFKKSMRRPFLQSPMLAMPTPTVVTLPSWSSMFMERKKAVFIPPAIKAMQRKQHLGTLKRMNIDNKHRKIETKIANTNVDTRAISNPLKQKKKSGFDPDSIVIESGFKPIISNIHSEINRESTQTEDGEINNVESTTLNDNNNKRRTLDEERDMEMEASEHNQVYYLSPPVLSDDSSMDTLVTYDGKKIMDKDLLRTSSKITNQPGPITLDFMRKNPQVGVYQGELPLALKHIRSQDQSHTGRTSLKNKSMQGSDVREVSNAKITLINRSKRTAHSDNVANDSAVSSWNFEHDHTGHVYNHNGHTHYHPEHTDNHDHGLHHEHDNHGEHEHHDHHNYTLASTGQMIFTNIEYIVLTVILYYVI